MRVNFARLWRENKNFLLFIVLMFVFRSSFADWYTVPTGSMKPTIVEGDRIFVNKLAFRLEVPFSDIPLLNTGEPERGDIVVFNSAAADERLIKRVIGLPGDTVAMSNNRLYLNGTPLEYEFTSPEEGIEHIGGVSHALQITSTHHPLSSFGPVAVPAGHILVLGDNRNNSADSRVYGFVPMEELQGKALRVIVSLDPDNYYLPRSSRNFLPLI